MRPRGRKYEKNKNKKGIKNNKETRFKWSCKKNRSFDIECIIKWDVKCYKVVFLRCQMLRVCLVTVFSPYFLFSKKKIIFLRLKNLFGNSKLAENKNCF